MAVPATDKRFLRQRVAAAYCDACTVELEALKPGNVHHYAAGHGMSVEDFVVSARVSADPLTEFGLDLGERILDAVVATRAAVGCNTNLGILLLCAPLVHAVLDEKLSGNLRERLRGALRQAGPRDTEHVFRAIALAAPAGLGTAKRYDVSGPAEASLRRVMAYAAPRDFIARQYATDFLNVFQQSLPLFRRLRALWQDEAWAAAAVFLDLLSRFPDTHIMRKHGAEKAEEVKQMAVALARKLPNSVTPERFRQRLLELDSALKQEHINPGTSADLTVATLLVARLEPMCSGFERTAGTPRVRDLRTVGPGEGRAATTNEEGA